MRNLIVILVTCCLFVIVTRTAVCEDNSLKVGSVAPKLDIEHWHSDGKGAFKSVTDFQDGKVYIVEFWATWCGPCIASMPHLNELQTKYRNKGLQIISVSDESAETVDSFLKQSVNGSNDETYADLTSVYCLTTDPDMSTHKDYMAASGQTGIPAAFIVGKKGQIEWIGHPLEIDEPLEKVINNNWDRAAYVKKIEEEKAAMKEINERMQLVSEHMNEDKTDEAIKIIDQLVSKYSSLPMANQLKAIRLQILLSSGDKRAATALKEFTIQNDDPEFLTQLGMDLYDMKMQSLPIDESVMKTAIDALGRSAKKNQTNFPLLDTLAHLYHANNQLDRAIAVQKLAIANAGQFKEELQPFLDQLEDEKNRK